MRTTIDISDALIRELRDLAHATRRPFRKVVEETLQRGLGTASSRVRRPRVQIQTSPVGIKPALRALSMNQIYDQIEAEDGGRDA